MVAAQHEVEPRAPVTTLHPLLRLERVRSAVDEVPEAVRPDGRSAASEAPHEALALAPLPGLRPTVAERALDSLHASVKGVQLPVPVLVVVHVPVRVVGRHFLSLIHRSTCCGLVGMVAFSGWEGRQGSRPRRAP